MSDKICYLDCVGGIAGDMVLAALIDAGGNPALVERFSETPGFSDVEISIKRGRPGGFAATQVEIGFDPSKHPHSRNLRDVVDIINKADVSERARENAIAIFSELAKAEAQAHGVPIGETHFHEVGAVDAIIDILATCILLDDLGVDKIVCSPLPMGSGTVECDHGTIPVPAPAVVEMLQGVPVYDAGVEAETVTPTGAAIAITLSDRFGGIPSMTVESKGIGAGSRINPGIPNIVRVFIGTQLKKAGDIHKSDNYIIECNIDDLEPRVYPFVIERLLDTGALDAYVTPVVMKKGRPGHVITVISDANIVDSIIDVLMSETTTLGCRVYPVEKYFLERKMATASTPWGDVPVKLALKDGKIIRRIPEYEACAKLARENGVPVREIIQSAMSSSQE